MKYGKTLTNIRRLEAQGEECSIKMTIYRREGNPGGKRNSRYPKFPSMSRKRYCLKGLPPIYEIDEDCDEEISFRDDKDSNHRLFARRLGNEDHVTGKHYLQVHTNKLKADEVRVDGTNEHNQHQQRGQELYHVEDKKRTWSYLKRNFDSPICPSKGNNQMVFPDFFPPGMHVHCAQNALPEVTTRLYMKIIQGNSKLEHARNICHTNDTNATDTDDNSTQYQRQKWMQFFG